MVQSLCFTVLLLTIITLASCTQISYYWREYVDKIPDDAIKAGLDREGNNVYIGQAYVKNEGLFTVPIIPGARETYAAIKGAKKVTEHIKILCGPLDNFTWLPSNASTLHLALLNKRFIIGGHEDGRGNIGIGRVSYEGGTQVGKVNTFCVGEASFFWVDKNKREQHVSTFEILIYDHEEDIRLAIDTRGSFN